MKKNLFFIALSAILVTVGCSKDNTVKVDGIEIPKAIVDNFEKQYPNAKNVKWSKRAPYTIATFDLSTTKAALNSADNTVWYDDAANCLMEELDMPVSQLPQPIQQSLKESIYANCEIDDIDVISREGFAKVYVLEVEGKTTDGKEVDADLYFSEDGILLRVVPDNDDEYDSLISEINLEKFFSFLKERYGEYFLIEADVEDYGYIELEIITVIDNTSRKLDVVFGRDGNFIYDVYEVDFKDAPEAIRNYISDKYPDQDTDEINIARTAEDKTFYVFEIEIEETDIEKDIVLSIDEQGNVSEVEIK